MSRRGSALSMLVLSTTVPSVSAASVRRPSWRAAQDLRVGGRTGRPVRADRLVERHQAARIDRIEADVGAVGALGQLLELHRQIGQRQQRPLALARLQAAVLESGRPRREPAVGAGADRLRPARHQRAAAGLLQRPGQPLVGARQRPAFGQQQHEAALLALPLELVEQVVEGVQRLLLPPPLDERLGDPGGAADVGIAHLRARSRADRTARRAPRSPHAQLAASICATGAVRGEKVMLRADISGVITPTRSSSPITRSSSVGHRLLRPIRALHLHVQRVEEQDEQARVGLRRPLTRLGHGVGLDARRRPAPTPRARTSSKLVTCCGALSSCTSKSSAVRSVTGGAVGGRDVDVEPHQVGAAAEARLLRRFGRRLLRAAWRAAAEGGQQDGHRQPTQVRATWAREHRSSGAGATARRSQRISLRARSTMIEHAHRGHGQRHQRILQGQQAQPDHEDVLGEADRPVAERFGADVDGGAGAGLGQVAAGGQGAAQRARPPPAAMATPRPASTPRPAPRPAAAPACARCPTACRSTAPCRRRTRRRRAPAPRR